MMQTQFPVSQLSPAVTIVQCDAACTNIKRAIFFRHLLLHSIRYLFKYCLDIWCFTRTLERYLFKDSHSTEACDGCCKTSFQHRPLQPLIVSFLHFSQPGRAKPLSIYNDVDHWCLITHHHHQWLWVIVDDVGYNDDDDFWHLTMTEEDLVTSPSFLSTARALLSIHCRESMCAFNTCTQVFSFKPVWNLETCASLPCRSDGQGLWSPGSLQLSSGAQ